MSRAYPIEDIKIEIQEWFAHEYNLIDLVSLYAEIRVELDKQLECMVQVILKDALDK